MAAEPEQGKTIRVGYYENEVFQEGAEEGAVKRGYAYEYYRKLSEYTGWDYEYVYGSYSDLYDMLLKGEIDLLAGLAKTDERIGFIGYPDLPMGNETYSLVKHEEDVSVTAEPKTLSGKKVGVLEGAIANSLDAYLDDNHVVCEVKRFGDYESLFQEFDGGEIDILAAEGDGASSRDHVEVIGPFGSTDYYLCVAKDRADILKQLDIAQAQLASEEPNYISSLRIRYYSSSLSSRSFSPAEREWLKEHDMLKIGYLENYLPYSTTGEDGEVTGIIKDIIPAIFDKLGIGDIKVSYQGYLSYADMIGAACDGTVDVAFPVGGGVYYSEENGIYQSTPVASTSTDLVYKGDYTDEALTYFAYNKNNLMQYYYITTNFPEAEIKSYDSIDDCLHAVLSGEVTATTLNGLRANDIIKNSAYSGLNLKQLWTMDDRSFGVKIGNEGLIKLLNRGVSVMGGSEYAQSIASRYTGDLYTYTFRDLLDDYMGYFLIVLFLIIGLIFLFIYRDMQRSKRASKLKSDFVSNMSHEMRTPVTAILGMNELIRRESTEDSIRKYADNIERAGESLLGIINDILDFSKIESGRMEIITGEYSLPDLLLGLCVMIEYRAKDKGLDFEVEVDESLPSGLIGDEQKICQVITNLLTNAVKYTMSGSVKLIVCNIPVSDTEMKLEVKVQDTGIGIREEEKDKLFSAFDRLDLDHTKSIEGTGLGLAITRRMLEQMGSTILVESTYGEGSCFSFELTQGISDKTPIGDFGKFEKTGTKGHDRVTFKAPKARLLLVDDTPMNLQVISGLLKEHAMTIDTADSGMACIERFKEGDYDIVFMDHRMPVMDGVETLAELKRRYPEVLKKTPVISLTANVLSGAEEQMIGAGFSGYLTKPVNLAEMDKILLTYLPKEKIITDPDQKERIMTDPDLQVSEPVDEPEREEIPEKVLAIKGLDVSRGLEYCGDADSFLFALEIYQGSVSEKIGQMQAELEKEDMEAFSLIVHSLKSTSKAVGLQDISDRARDLEAAANAGDTESVGKNAPELITRYRDIGERIKEALDL
ncbi:MAG: transporter substrate-binding domain-containing protein [Lachnospiraceae bacterium]|nr:transporter substrate-binding domain-containing protein [Lachnospiraceae bacterium]